MVSLDNFCKKYREVESSLNATPKLVNRKSSTSSDVNTLRTRMTLGDDNGANGSIIENGSDEESEEFRIRVFMEYKASFIRRMNEHTTKGIPVLTPVQQLLDEVAIVVPSVLRNITGSNEPNPLVIIRPSYFDNISDDEQPLMFSTHTNDEKHSFSSFRRDLTKESDSLVWLRRLPTHGSPISLSTLMLARFEWAAWESYLEFEYSKPTIAYEHTELTADHTDGEPKNHLLSILGDVLSHCLAVNDRSLTIDSTTLESFVAPLVKTCFTDHPGADPVSVDDVQHVILTPLSWVWFASHGQTDRAHDVLDEIDKAVQSSLERMDNNKEMSGIGERTSSDNGAYCEHNLQRKKKKKNKKKKVRD